MKKTLSLILPSIVLSIVTACSNQQIIQTDVNELTTISSSNSLKTSAYPFDVNKDFFPLYDQSFWKYEVFDSKNKLVSTLTKTLNATSNESSIELDNKNKYYVTIMKKEYSNQEVKDKTTYEYLRRRDNQLAYGKFDNLTYYPSSNKSFDPYDFRPFIKFESNKLETVKVKAGSFQCLKTEFTLGMDKYTIWYAKGVGEVKRVKEGYFDSYTYSLSEYSNTSKQFVIRKENLDFNKLPKNIIEKCESVKSSYLKINQLPADLFESKVLVPKTAYNDFVKNVFEITYSNRGISLKEVVTLKVLVDKDGNIKDMLVSGDGVEKPTYNGKLVDKLPTLL